MRPRKISELGDAFWFKLGHGGVPVLLPIAHALEIGIKGVKECGGIDKKKHSVWPSRGWQARSGSQFSPFDDGGQSSQDQWRSGKRFPTQLEELRTLAKDKKGTCINICNESVKRENRSPCHG